ncbi:MAG: NAD(P)-dependent oxidoreductase [Dehalococcoidia bacterium]|nr:MAG: NAD(P)-dependent oxidoreductase [Dehalococcoidia bacterium]
MKVLLTGALGNIGRNATKKLIEQGHQVRCFDLKTRANEKVAQRIEGQIEVVWGDVRSPDDLAAAVQGQDVIIHLAFIMPPASEDRPQWAREINVAGTENLLQAMKTVLPPPKIIFSSTFSVFGDTQSQPPPRTVSDPVKPVDNYTRHKVECERLVQESGLDWAIFRFAVVPPMSLGGVEELPKMFDFPLDMRIEFVHPRDAGLALANAVGSKKVWGKTLLIGGGPSGQLYYRDFMGRMMNAMGIGMLPERAFGSKAAMSDWLDTSESQSLLNYQQHTFEDFVQEIASLLGYKRYLVPLFRPLIRRWVLQKSPYFRAKR